MPSPYYPFYTLTGRGALFFFSSPLVRPSKKKKKNAWSQVTKTRSGLQRATVFDAILTSWQENLWGGYQVSYKSLKVCIHYATGCSNMSQRQTASCILENFSENLCLCNRILSQQHVAKNQIRQNLCDLSGRQNRQVSYSLTALGRALFRHLLCKNKTNIGNLPLSCWKTIEIFKTVRF